MAMKAGREGLASKDVDARGKLKAGHGGLTPEQQAKLDRALLTPVNTLAEKQLTGVGTGKDQIMLKVGNGLKITGSTSPFDLGLDAPVFTDADAGKVLTIAADGSLEWAEGGAGGGIGFNDFRSLPKLENVSRSGGKLGPGQDTYYVFDTGSGEKNVLYYAGTASVNTDLYLIGADSLETGADAPIIGGALQLKTTFSNVQITTPKFAYRYALFYANNNAYANITQLIGIYG